LRRHQFERLAHLVSHPEWLDDKRLATPWDWADRSDDLLCPAITQWASSIYKQEASRLLAEGGVPAAPCNSAEDIVRDPHVAVRRMLVEIPRTDGGEQPVMVAGNPIKMSDVAEGPESSFPLLGEHTDLLLRKHLGLSETDLGELRKAGVIG
jgi:crotonobetainyl-CoA:carnitine CoA-transferase CaiB-like acyl-CoA transferase